MSTSIIDIANDGDATDASLLDNDISTGNNKKSVLFFWAEWHAPSNTGGPFDTVVKTLAGQQQTSSSSGSVQFYRVLAEEAPNLSRKHNVTTVPTFLFINADGTVLSRIDGGEDVAPVTQCYSKLVNSNSTAATTSSSSPDQNQSQPSQQQQQQQQQQEAPNSKGKTTQQTLDDRLRSLVTSSPIVLFQKGTPDAPRCGFSRQATEILAASDVSFAYFDIMEDDEVRRGLKSYSDWPTYPQLYVNGELVGGLDIMRELMEEEGGLVEQLELGEYVRKNGDDDDTVAFVAAGEDKEEEAAAVPIDDRLRGLINRHRIMLFMKGIPSAPRCGFSRQIVECLDSYDVSYDAFNIMEDDEVRQGLKAYSDWPTYPQLYVDGDLVGGLDIVKEMEEGGDLDDLLKG